jgi:large subunit ribosomal protein L27e
MLTISIAVLKIGRVAIITRGRYAGKKVNFHLLRSRCIHKSRWRLDYQDGFEMNRKGECLRRILQVVIIQPQDTGNKSHPYPHALVAGIERYPSQITRRMSKTRQAKRSKVKPFIKVINYNHLMPTRYTLELEGLKGVVTADTFKEVSQREEAKKTVKKALEERYTSGKNRWFFTPLSMLIWIKIMVDGWLTYVFCRILNDSSASSGPDGMGCYIMALVA